MSHSYILFLDDLKIVKNLTKYEAALKLFLFRRDQNVGHVKKMQFIRRKLNVDDENGLGLSSKDA
jgi:hypothetical protein